MLSPLGLKAVSSKADPRQQQLILEVSARWARASSRGLLGTGLQ
jgi:hypothetical protein